jgi:hypothetical protein
MRTTTTRRVTFTRRVTLFSWGYGGWGNATKRLVSAVDEVERGRGFEPPLFVDIRYSRAVRAIGFRDRAFEEQLGHARYRWMKSLGNANIGTHRGGVRIKCPDAADQLLDLALDAAEDLSRVIFFCSCPSPDDAAVCHRATVAKLILRASRRRGTNSEVVEWPGGAPGRRAQKMNVTEAMLQSVLEGRALLPVRGAREPKHFVGLPWGSLVELKSPRRTQLVSTGAARFIDGHWRLPVFLFPVEDGDGTTLLLSEALRRRREDGLEPRRS